MPNNKIQKLTDEFNRTYWIAATNSDEKKFYEATLLARQLVVELGRQNIIHDKILDPEYTNKSLIGL